jgi:multiple sugar transport system ATP-binding protein
MSSVQIENVRKSYGAVPILHGVSVDIDDGEFVILVGPSGCGKSTLLRMIAGLETITAGQIKIGDRVVNNLEPKERDIAMVFQNYALYPQMTVAQNMGFALEMRGVGRADIRKKVEEAAAILGLQPLLERKPAQLSGGQRQRVAMGRAIVRDPKVFLFDEPLSNLDAKLRVQMRAEIKALQQRLSTTTVYVTHDQIEAMTMADKIVVMQSGRVEQIGAPLDLYDKPANRFVAGFLGSPAMNFLEGTLRLQNGPKLELAGGQSVPLSRMPDGSDGRKVVFGIRPEEIRIAEDGVDARLVVVEPTGSETLLSIDFAGQELTCLLRQRASLSPGQDVKLSFASDSVHFFDPDSGVRIDSDP